MNPRTALLGALAVVLAFGSAFAFATAGAEPRLAHAKGPEVIAVHRDLAAIPFLAPHGPPPQLAKRRSHHPHHHHRRAARLPRVAATPPPQDAARDRTPLRSPAPAGRPRPVPRRSSPSPDPGDRGAPPERVPVQVRPVPTQAAPPPEPDPGDQTDEDPNAEAPE